MGAMFEDHDCWIYYAWAENLPPNKEAVRRQGSSFGVHAGTTVREVIQQVKLRVHDCGDVLILREKPRAAWMDIPESLLEFRLEKTFEVYFKAREAGRKRKADDDSPEKKRKNGARFLKELLSCTRSEVQLSTENILRQLPQLPFYKIEENEQDREEEENGQSGEEIAPVLKQLPQRPFYKIEEKQDRQGGEENGQCGEEVSPVVPQKWVIYDFNDAVAMQSFWGRSTRRTKIIERESYVELWEKHVHPAFFEEKELVSFVVLGNPGFGKSGFLLYVLYKLLQLKQRVMLRGQGGNYHLFDLMPDGEYEYTFNADGSVLLEENVFFLADGKLTEVPHFQCNAMLCCTPYKKNFKEYDKDARCRRLYLPMWSADELALARQEIFSTLELDSLQKQYDQWGGNPRFLFEKVDLSLDKIIFSVEDIESHVRVLDKGEADAEHPSHKLLQMQVQVGYKGFRYVFASPYVEEGVFKKLYHRQKESLYKFIAFQGKGIEGYQALKGSMLQWYFKEEATRVAAAYEVWQVYEVGSGSGPKEQRQFAFDNLVEPDSLDTLVLPERPGRYNKLYWPKSKNTESIECFTITEGREGEADKLDAFQVTLNCKRHGHGLKYKGILNLMNKCEIGPCNTRIYIVTLPELKDCAGYQDWRIENNKVLKSESIRTKLIGIQQYIMVCNWSPGTVAHI